MTSIPKSAAQDGVSEMVRRVATAICQSRTCEGVSCCHWPANRGRAKCPVKDGGYDDAARDAIAAICPATDEMIIALLNLSEADAGKFKAGKYGHLREKWTERTDAMIDAALK